MQVGIATIRAGLRHAYLVAAVMAAQALLVEMQHHLARAMLAAGQPAAAGAHQHRRITAPVDEQQALFAALDAKCYFAQQVFADAVVHHGLVGVDAAHRGQARVGQRAPGQFEHPVSPALALW